MIHRAVCCKQCVICVGGRTRSRQYRFPGVRCPAYSFPVLVGKWHQRNDGLGFELLVISELDTLSSKVRSHHLQHVVVILPKLSAIYFFQIIMMHSDCFVVGTIMLWS